MANLQPQRANVAGIDIGDTNMHVCGPVQQDGTRLVRTFETTTGEIVACGRWLQEMGVVSVAMESTGVYWIPVLEILESMGLETLLVDTRPMSRVPGRKTDVRDCEWIQTLHSHGLLRGCFRPHQQVTELRTIVRRKRGLVNERSDCLRRMQKELSQMNIRLHHAVSDIQGATGMAILAGARAGLMTDAIFHDDP